MSEPRVNAVNVEDQHGGSQHEASPSDYLLEPEEAEELDEPVDDPTRVIYAGQDFDIFGLVRRLNNGDIVVPQFGGRSDDGDLEVAGFQRGFVWSKSQMDRFIESLLLGFPIPGIFLVRQADGRLLVLDGQQRLRTLQSFYSGVRGGREFILAGVAEEFRGLSYKTLDDVQRRKIDDAFIQATIVEVQPNPTSTEAVYQIFERLNSGGTQLTAHEIRIALYAGPIVEYLEELNVSSFWRDIYGPKNPRARDQELIARILAMYLNWSEYARPLKMFINHFMEENKGLVTEKTRHAGELFTRACKLLAVEGYGVLRWESRQVNTAWSDALFVGVMSRLAEGGDLNDQELSRGVAQLRANKSMPSLLSGSSSDEYKVEQRMLMAISAFSGSSD